jgi:hypothetical protein
MRPLDDSSQGDASLMAGGGYLTHMRAPSPPPHKGSIAALLNSPSLSPSRSEDSNHGVIDTESSGWFSQLPSQSAHHGGQSAIHSQLIAHSPTLPAGGSNSSVHPSQQQQQQQLTRDPYAGGIDSRTLPPPPPPGSFYPSNTTSVPLPSISQSLSTNLVVTHSPPQLAPLRLPSLYGTSSMASSSYDEEYRVDASGVSARYVDDRDKSSGQMLASTSRYSPTPQVPFSLSPPKTPVVVVPHGLCFTLPFHFCPPLSLPYHTLQVSSSYRVVADADSGYAAYGARHYYPYRQATALASPTTLASGDHLLRDGGAMPLGRRDEPPVTAMATSTSSSSTSSGHHHGYRTAGDSVNVPVPSASPYSYSYSRSSLYGSTSSSPYTLGSNLFAGSAVPAHLWTATAPAPTSSLVSSTTSTSTSTSAYSAPSIDKLTRDEEISSGRQQHKGAVMTTTRDQAAANSALMLHTYVDDIHARPFRSSGAFTSSSSGEVDTQRSDTGFIQRDLAVQSYGREAFEPHATSQPTAEMGILAGTDDHSMEVEEEASGSIPQLTSSIHDHRHGVSHPLSPAAEMSMDASHDQRHAELAAPMDLEEVTRHHQSGDPAVQRPLLASSASSVLDYSTRATDAMDGVAITHQTASQEPLASSAPIAQHDKRPVGSVFAMAAEAGIGTGLEYVHGHAPSIQAMRPSSSSSAPELIKSTETVSLRSHVTDEPRRTEEEEEATTQWPSSSTSAELHRQDYPHVLSHEDAHPTAFATSVGSSVPDGSYPQVQQPDQPQPAAEHGSALLRPEYCSPPPPALSANTQAVPDPLVASSTATPATNSTPTNNDAS